jgi:hypothetical protein
MLRDKQRIPGNVGYNIFASAGISMGETMLEIMITGSRLFGLWKSMVILLLSF